MWLPDYRAHHPEGNSRSIDQKQLAYATLVRERWITLGNWIITHV